MRSLKSLLAIVVLILALAAISYRIMTFDICDTRIDRKIPGPGNGLDLVIFHRDCGATVDFNTQASLVPNGRGFSFDRYPAFFSIAGQHTLDVRWLSPKKIQLLIPSGDKIYRQDRKIGSVFVIY